MAKWKECFFRLCGGSGLRSVFVQEFPLERGTSRRTFDTFPFFIGCKGSECHDESYC